MVIKELVENIKQDYELCDRQIYNAIKHILLAGIDDEEQFVEILYDVCSRIATCEVNKNSYSSNDRLIQYKRITEQAIEYYNKEHYIKR